MKVSLLVAFLIAAFASVASADGLVVGQDSYADVLRENGARIEHGGALVVEPDRHYYPDIDAPDLEPSIPGDGLNFWLEGELFAGIPECAGTDSRMSTLTGILGRRFYDNSDLSAPAAVAHAMAITPAFNADPELVAKLLPEAFGQSQTIVGLPVSSESKTEIKFYRSSTATIVALCVPDEYSFGAPLRCVGLITTNVATFHMQFPARTFLKTNQLECIIGALVWLQRETKMHVVK